MTKKKKIIYEKCVSCHEVTDIDINAHVSTRNYYIEGAGQLCPKCYFTIYGWEKIKR